MTPYGCICFILALFRVSGIKVLRHFALCRSRAFLYGPHERSITVATNPLFMLCRTRIYGVLPCADYWHEQVNNLDGTSLLLETVTLNVFPVIDSVSQGACNTFPYII